MRTATRSAARPAPGPWRCEVGQVRHAVEVHEHHAAAALHASATPPPASRCRPTAARPPCRPSPPAGRPARAAVGVDERLAGQHLHPHLELGVLEAHPHVGSDRSSTRAPRARLSSTEVIGNVLKARRAVIRNDRNSRPSIACRRRLAAPPATTAVRRAERDVGHPAHARRAARARAPDPGDASRSSTMRPGRWRAATGPRSAIARSRLRQVAQEERPVAALEADLVVVDDRGGRVERARSAITRPRPAAVLGSPPVDRPRHLDLRRLSPASACGF